MQTFQVSKRAGALTDLLAQALSEDILVTAPDGTQYLLTAVHNGDRLAAIRHRSKVVMAFLDELAKEGKIPPVEVVFVPTRPDTKRRTRPRPRRRVQKAR